MKTFAEYAIGRIALKAKCEKTLSARVERMVIWTIAVLFSEPSFSMVLRGAGGIVREIYGR